MLYHLIVCRFYNNDQWLTIVECMFLLYQPIRNVTYKITPVLCTILLYHPIFYNINHFEPCSAGHATVSRRQWYPIAYWPSKLTNRVLSPWPLSFHSHQEWPRLQAMASRMVREEQTLAVVIIMFGSILCLLPLNCHALKWCVLMFACIFWQYCTPKLVLQCKTTKGLLEYFVPDVPRSSGTVVLGVRDFCVQYWFRSRSPTQTVIWH